MFAALSRLVVVTVVGALIVETGSSMEFSSVSIISSAFPFPSRTAVEAAGSMGLNGSSNLHGVCTGKGSGCSEIGDAITDGSNEKGRRDASILVLISVLVALNSFRLGHGGEGWIGRTEETEWPQARKM